MKTHHHHSSFWFFSRHPLISHATTNLAVLIASLILVLLLPYSAAQNEGLPSSPQPPQTTKSDGFSFDPIRLRLNPSVAIILVCILSAFFIMGCVFVSIRHCSQSQPHHHHHPEVLLRDDRAVGSRRRSRQAPRRGLDASVVDGFPIFRYADVKELRLGKGALECAVCLNEFEDDETLRLIPNCSHVFHPDCIDAWLASHVTCPVCRANLDPTQGDQGDDDGDPDPNPDPETHDSVPELPSSVPARDLSNPALETNNLGIHIHIGSPELIGQCQTTTARNALKTPRMNGKFPRSYSTGHTLVQPDKNCDRFTLRLPEDVRARLINSELSRARSCVSFTRVWSSTKGFRRSDSGGGTRANSTNRGRMDRVVRSEEFGYSISPGFVSGASSTPTMEGISGERSTTANSRNLLRPTKSFRTPLERLFSGTEKKEFDGERSFNRLMLDDI